MAHNDVFIKVKTLCKYFDHYIGQDAESILYRDAIDNLIINLHGILSLFSNAHTTVKYCLFQRYCMSMYGAVLWNFNSVGFKKVCTTWRKCIRCIFQLPNMTHSRYLSLDLQNVPIRLNIYTRVNQFLHSIVNSDNSIVRLCGRILLMSITSNVGENIKTILNESNCSREEVCMPPAKFNRKITNTLEAMYSE